MMGRWTNREKMFVLLRGLLLILCALPAGILAEAVAAEPQSKPDVKNVFGCMLGDSQRLVLRARRKGMRILDARGKFLGALGSYYAPPVAVNKLSRHFVSALIVSEDKRFFDHSGLDLVALGRAAFKTLTGSGRQGGSTITQQTLKNVCYKDDADLVRKIKEVFSAWEFEHFYTKPDILYIYLNSIYFGGRAYGVQAAARTYFRKYAESLNLLEIATLVQLLPAPNRYNPHVDAARAKKRAQRLIDRMAKAGFISERHAGREKRRKLKLAPKQRKLPGVFPRSSDDGWVAVWTRQQARARGLEGDGITTVETSINRKVQRAAGRQLNWALRRYGKRYRFDQGAIVVMTHDGHVLAMIGGRDFRSLQWNNATQAQRQPGSVFKPFIYLDALERGMRPTTRVDDRPLRIDGRSITNHDNKHKRSRSLSDALGASSNTVAARIALSRFANIVDVARRAGITSPMKLDIGLALGANEVTLLELVSAYATIANGGLAVRPRVVVKARDNFNKQVWCRGKQKRKRVFGRRATAELRQMLVNAVKSGTGKNADPGFFAGGKTGTTNGFRDAWFVGFTRRYVAGVWLGNENGAPMGGISGSGLPARIWRGLFREIADHRPIVPKCR